MASSGVCERGGRKEGEREGRRVRDNSTCTVHVQSVIETRQMQA